MSMVAELTYLVKCDYPSCGMFHDLLMPTEEDAIETIIYDAEWLCLSTGDNTPKFFCPYHLRHEQRSPNGPSTVFFDPDTPDAQPSLHDLNKFYEDMSTPQPLPDPECENTILAIVSRKRTRK